MDGARTLVVIPTFNERENIVQLLARIFALYPAIHVLVVDDSSKDGTAEAVREVTPLYGERLQLLVRSGKSGRGSAVLEGVKRALAGPYDYVFEMDADFSHRPEEIALFFPKMETADCVIGSRYISGSEIRDWGWKRTVFSHFANLYARLVLRIPISDYTNGFRCYNRRAAASIDPQRIDAKGYVVLSEVAYQLHRQRFRFAEVPTLFVNRRRGISNLGFHEINEAFFSVLRIRWPRLSLALTKIGTFAVRGIIGTVIDLLSLFLLLEYWHLNVLPAFIVSSLLATGIMVFLRQQKWGQHAVLSPQRFLLLYGVVDVCVVILALILFQIDAAPIFAKFVAILLAAPLSYRLGKKLLP